MNEIKEQTLLELDFNKEEEFMNKSYKIMIDNNLKSLIPKSINILNSDKMIVMEYIEGNLVSFDNNLFNSNYNNKLYFFENVVKSFAIQIHKYGLFNGDPHPGNILVNDNKIPVILDWGNTKLMNEEDKYNMC